MCAILHSQGPPVLVFGHSCPQVLALFMSPTNKHPLAVPQALGHTTAAVIYPQKTDPGRRAAQALQVGPGPFGEEFGILVLTG